MARKITAGRSLIAIGCLHFVVGLQVGWEPTLEIFRAGLLGAVPDDEPWRMAIFWFQFFGFLLLLVGASWDWVEQQGLELPAWMGVGLLLVAAGGILCMPASGFWTVVPVGVYVIRRSMRGSGQQPA